MIRTVWGRTATVLVFAAATAACSVGGDPTVAVARAAPPGSAAATVERIVPGPRSGALRARLAPLDPVPDGPRRVLLFGDSVAVLAADELARELPGTELHVDAVDCRRLDRGFSGPCGGVPAGTAVPAGLTSLADIADELGTEGVDLDAAVLVIANNAALRASDLDAAMAVLEPIPSVWWVSTDVEGRAWRDPNNALLADLAERHPRAGVIDWFATSRGEDWRADHVHPGEEGQAAMAELVAEHLRCDCAP